VFETNAKPRLDVALIGCGRIAQTHLQAIANNSSCRLLAVADVNEAAALSVAADHGCQAFSHYRDLAGNVDLDAVVICSPPSTHAEIALFFLEKGVHVLCEKPLAIRSDHAAMMVKRAEANNRLLMMASKFRYVDDVIEAKAMLESGALGEIILFENVFSGRVEMRGRWNSVREISGGGVLIDNGSHSVDIARYLLGPITRVQAEDARRVQRLEVEDTARICFRTESNAMGNIDLSWSIHKERESYIDLYGSEGTLSIGWKHSKYRRHDMKEWKEFGQGYDKVKAFGRQFANFIGSIQGHEQPRISGQDALESVRVIEAAYKSASSNRWVNVEPIAEPTQILVRRAA